MRKQDAGYLPRAIQVKALSPVDEIHDPRSTVRQSLPPGWRANFLRNRTASRSGNAPYAAALADFSGVGSLISSFRVGAATLGAGIVISSTPF